jgi:hypothetical protein
VTVTALLLLVGLPYYAFAVRHRDDTPRREHSAPVDSTQAADEPGVPATPIAEHN